MQPDAERGRAPTAPESDARWRAGKVALTSSPERWGVARGKALVLVRLRVTRLPSHVLRDEEANQSDHKQKDNNTPNYHVSSCRARARAPTRTAERYLSHRLFLPASLLPLPARAPNQGAGPSTGRQYLRRRAHHVRLTVRPRLAPAAGLHTNAQGLVCPPRSTRSFLIAGNSKHGYTLRGHVLLVRSGGGRSPAKGTHTSRERGVGVTGRRAGRSWDRGIPGRESRKVQALATERCAEETASYFCTENRRDIWDAYSASRIPLHIACVCVSSRGHSPYTCPTRIWWLTPQGSSFALGPAYRACSENATVDVCTSHPPTARPARAH